MNTYVVGRSATKTPQPRCMHILDVNDTEKAACGQPLRYSSRSYTDTPLTAIMCRNCERIMR